MEILSKNWKTARTFMPEIIAPGTGLSPLTPKSVIPVNNVFTLQDALNGRKYKLPGAGGSWGDGEDIESSYKEEGDAYRRNIRDAEILSNMTQPLMVPKEKWKVRVPGGSQIFDSFEAANRYKRELQNKGIRASWVSRVAQNNQSRVEITANALAKTFMVESINVFEGVKEIGSAFCIGDGLFLTCAHVIKKYNKLTEQNIDSASLSGKIKINIVQNGQNHEAQLLNFNSAWDIALLKCDIRSDSFQFDTNIAVGEEIFAIGSPHGFDNNVTFGTIGSLDRDIYGYENAPKYIFVDLSAFPGNSGGPVIKVSNGKVVGMITAIVSPKGDYGLNAGLPSTYLEQFCKMNNVI